MVRQKLREMGVWERMRREWVRALTITNGDEKQARDIVCGECVQGDWACDCDQCYELRLCPERRVLCVIVDKDTEEVCKYTAERVAE